MIVKCWHSIALMLYFMLNCALITCEINSNDITKEYVFAALFFNNY